jgi:hypothetical protein
MRRPLIGRDILLRQTMELACSGVEQGENAQCVTGDDPVLNVVEQRRMNSLDSTSCAVRSATRC